MTGAPNSRGPLEIGGKFRAFEIRALLGKGGHAWVYHGYDEFLDHHVAIKIIPDPKGEPSRDLRQRAQYEARVLKKIVNPNVVAVSEAGYSADGAVYIVMEHLVGRTLREAIHAHGRLTVSEVLSLAQKVAAGMQAAHLAGAVHRDLKPENVFIVEREGGNGVKVLDFGIAKLFGFGAATTQQDIVHGTLQYMSPEQVQGMPVSKRTDIYSLGALLYEALYGTVPCLFGIPEPTLNSVSYAIINRMPPMLNELVPSVPRALARTIQRMLAKNESERFASMQEVSEAFAANEAAYLAECGGEMPAERQLWLAPSSVPCPMSGVSLSSAITKVHVLSDLASSTLPTVSVSPVSVPTTQGIGPVSRNAGIDADTAPVSRPSFLESRLVMHKGASSAPVLVTEPIPVVRPAPTRPTPPPPAFDAAQSPQRSLTILRPSGSLAPAAVPASAIAASAIAAPAIAPPLVTPAVPTSQVVRRTPLSAPPPHSVPAPAAPVTLEPNTPSPRALVATAPPVTRELAPRAGMSEIRAAAPSHHGTPPPITRTARPTPPRALRSLSIQADRLYAAVVVGLIAGLGAGLLAYWPHPSTTPDANSDREQPIVVLSTQPIPSEQPPATPTVTVPAVTLPPPSPPPSRAVDAPIDAKAPVSAIRQHATPAATAPAPTKSRAPSAEPARTSRPAITPMPIASVPAQTAAKPARKAPVPAVSSGLWDMSDLLNPPVASKPAASTAAKPPNKALY